VTQTLSNPRSSAAASLSVSVIIPVHNGGAPFGKCLAGLADLTPQPDEVIIVADGESDGSWRQAEAAGYAVVRLPTSGGPAQARNAGAACAAGEILYFIDADVVAHPDAIAKVRQTFEDEPDLSAVIGSYDDEPASPQLLAQYKNLQHHFVHQTGGEEAFTFWAGCGAIRRDVFESLHGFDASYREPSIEDIELGYRLKAAGHRIRLRKDLQVKHLKRWTAVSLVKTDFFKRALPWSELILKQKNLPNDLNINAASRLSVVSVYLLLIALCAAPLVPKGLTVVGASVLVLLVLNRDFYLFLLRKRGPWFTIRILPWHWFYFFYSGLAFAIVNARHVLRSMVSPARRHSSTQTSPLVPSPGTPGGLG
jgi:glycosyltransferase involved in cell wall biosynthesis